MTGRELRERHEGYERASGTDAAWDLLAGSIEDDVRERVGQIIAHRERSPDEAVEARRAQAFDSEA